MTKSASQDGSDWIRVSVPTQLHALMHDRAFRAGVPVAEAYRRAVRWAAREGAWGLVVSGPTMRFDLVLTPALVAELASRADSDSKLVTQAASAWILHHSPPAWLGGLSLPDAGASVSAPRIAAPPAVQLRDLLHGGSKMPCTQLAEHLGISWAQAHGLLEAAACLGDKEATRGPDN